MKINGVNVAVCRMNVERVDDAYIMHDPVSRKVIMFNRTASLIWDMITEHSATNVDVCTGDLIASIVKLFDAENLAEHEVRDDIDRTITNFFSAGLLRRG